MFDIDLTLINSNEYKDRSLNALTTYTHKSTVEVEVAREQYVRSLATTKDFHPKELAKWIAMSFGYDEDKILEIIWNNEILKGLTYDEVEGVLGKLGENNTLGIYSEGFEELQKLKLEANRIDKYFDPKWVYITRRKIGDRKFGSLGKVTIVDDNIEICKMLKDYKEVEVYWLNRKTNKKAKGVKTIHNLTELINEIN